MDNQPLTQIFANSLQAEQPAPLAPTPVSAPKESQGQINHKLTKGGKQLEKQGKSKNALGHAQGVHHRSSQSESQADLFTCDLAGPVSITIHNKHPSIDHGMTYFIIDNLPLTLEHLVASALEHCIKRQPNQSQTQTLRALANITMFLMQKYLKPDGVIGINSTCWQSDPLEFLSATASVTTIQDLQKHPLITKHRRSPGTLTGLARLCLITTRTFITKPWVQK
ncbi:uncharacterized protein BJX67DRAFT_371441 [Aspergillus lucknowensis]|uniref:Uncharacterized protein n=1 Tax=Aspergillus lucknowensis TaxID=176173 RepID=A0ABR4LV16_9EURO